MNDGIVASLVIVQFRMIVQLVSLLQWIAYLQAVYLGLYGNTLVFQSSLLLCQLVLLKS